MSLVRRSTSVELNRSGADDPRSRGVVTEIDDHFGVLIDLNSIFMIFVSSRGPSCH